tara:strand:- start:3887 stop:4141 length:255 start_codon:yes stop_codon:yes gene_type:complete
MKDVNFPVYRKYDNNKSFFEILSMTEFIEHKTLGSHYERIHIIAKQLPERNLISDLVSYALPSILESSQEEFNQIRTSHKLFSL